MTSELMRAPVAEPQGGVREGVVSPNMRDPNTPSITEAGSSATHTLNLNELGLRYLAAYLVEGTRLVTSMLHSVKLAFKDKVPAAAKKPRIFPNEHLPPSKRALTSRPPEK